MKIKEFDFVEIIVPTGKEFNDDRVGEVTRVDGCYIMVKRNISGVEIELYPHEMQLLEGEKAEMAYFQRNMWRGLRPATEKADSEYNWLTAGYMREVDWEAAQEENVTMTYDPLSLQEDFIFPNRAPAKGSRVETLPDTKWGKFATKLNLLNDRCQGKPNKLLEIVTEVVDQQNEVALQRFERKVKDFILKQVDIKNYDRAKKVVK